MNDPNGTIFWKRQIPHLLPVQSEWGFSRHDTLGTRLQRGSGPLDRPPDCTAARSGGSRPLPMLQRGSVYQQRGGAHPSSITVCLTASALPQATMIPLSTGKNIPANPIIPNPRPGDEYWIGGAPCAWVEGDTYYALTGNSGNAPPDVAYLYTSKDLAHWEYLHPFYEGGVFTEWGEDCGCPDFFRLGDKDVLSFTSHPRGAQFYIGNLCQSAVHPGTSQTASPRRCRPPRCL